MDLSTCPFCHLTVLSAELERHANSHFDDEDLDQDLQFAQEISLDPTNQPLNSVDGGTQCETSSWKIHESSTSTCQTKSCVLGERDITEKITALVSLQIKETYNQIGRGLMDMLRNCLELEPGNSNTVLCGFVDHFQSRKSEDIGWGCGWRNIQMLSSHLLKQRQEARKVLYGGSGFVPDIPSLQRWLEIAWGRGFDKQGADDFCQEIYGKRKWIGTTECAALFRSFGLRARIVDFTSREIVCSSTGGGKYNRALQVYGPMDRYLSKENRDVSEAASSTHDITANAKGQQVLIDWVWNYFSDNNVRRSDNQKIIVSQKAPLYFQHDGHSRTIVGIQTKFQKNGSTQHNLLILDPGHTTDSLAKSLKENVGWQKLIKRGVHTLKKPLYQLCFIDPGIASEEETEQLKVLHSIRVEF